MQQRVFNAFRDEYNHERPREAFGQATPATAFNKSSRSYPKSPELQYPEDYELRRLTNCGHFRWRGSRSTDAPGLQGAKETDNAFIYCLAEAAQRFDIDVILPTAMTNHHHTVSYDRHGTVPAFTEHFHKMLAKSQNALRGRWENFWSSEQVCVVQHVDVADIMRKLVYAATHPVKTGSSSGSTTGRA